MSEHSDYDEDKRVEDDESRGPNDDNRERRWNDSNAQSSATNENSEENPSLHVTSLSFESTEESLKGAFGVYGEVESASIIKDPITQESRGFGFVTFVNAADSDKAIEGLNGANVDGRVIRVERARRSRAFNKTPGQYLGNPKASVKYGRDGKRLYDNDRRGGGYRNDGGFPPRDGGYPPRGYDERRGPYDDRRGPYDDRRGPYDDRRGGGGGYDDRRGGYDDRRGGYDDRRGGGYPDPRGYPREEYRPNPGYDRRGPPPSREPYPYDDRRRPRSGSR